MQNSVVPTWDAGHAGRLAALTARVERIRLLNVAVHEKLKTAADAAHSSAAGAGQMVEQIAFQANLMLLNAAVEAAHTGVDSGSYMQEVRDSAAEPHADEAMVLVRRIIERAAAPTP